MLTILRLLNEKKDRATLIGRNAFNLLLASSEESSLFRTADYDVLCPDLQTADECRLLLEREGFRKQGGTFSGGAGELDILVADPNFPEGVLGGEYYNIPTLRPLWDAREQRDGVLCPGVEALLLDKLLHMRENEGKDTETVGIYFALRPDAFPAFLAIVEAHGVPEERDAMLCALYEAVGGSMERKSMIEEAMRRLLTQMKR